MINLENLAEAQSNTDILEKHVTFGSKGIKLNGTMYLPAKASSYSLVPAAIMCHGYGNKQAAFEVSARDLAAKGVAILTFDFRGHGDSGGKLDDSIVDDVMDAYNYLYNQPEVDHKRMGLIGHSMGATSAIVAAGKLKTAKVLIALSCPGEVNYAVVRNPKHFTFPAVIYLAKFLFKIINRVQGIKVRADWKKFLEFWPQTKPSKALSGLDDCSKLFVFCLRDIASPYQNFMYSYAMATEPKQVMIASGTHNTPMEIGTLQTQWLKWAENALHGKHVSS